MQFNRILIGSSFIQFLLSDQFFLNHNSKTYRYVTTSLIYLGINNSTIYINT